MIINSLLNRAKWPSKLNDFLAAGRPIVATRVGDVAALFQKKIGILTDDTPQALADGLVEIANNPEQAEHFGCRARALAEGELNWTTIVEQLESFYLEVRDQAP
jgi:glycosyltransferase involved in cell wall biosynthesis